MFEALGVFQGISFAAEHYVQGLFISGVPRFLPRSQAEEDPRYKQIIPYVILSSGDRYLSYVRGQRSGEQRLVGRRSIGIGGHINPGDDLPLFCDTLHEAYRAAVQREVFEELRIDGSYTERMVGVINDDSTPVGQVHLGIVHHWILETSQVARREQVITQLKFLSLPELLAVRDELESWSSLCLEYIKRKPLE